jgi:hypothetical protein
MRTALLAALGATASLACGEPAGPDPNAVASVVITPGTGSIDTGDSLHLSAVTRNSAGTDLTGKTITWSTLDATVVTVSGTGVVRGRWPGVARVVATSEGKADTTQVHVTPKITDVELTPSLDTVRSLTDTLRLTVHAAIDTQAFVGGSYSWAVSDTGIASVYSASAFSVVVQARANGATFVRVMEARGARDSALVVVRQRATQLILGGPLRAYVTCPLRARAFAFDARSRLIEDPPPPVIWSSTDTAVARIDSSGVIMPLAMGTDTIIARLDALSRREALTIFAPPGVTLQAYGARGAAVATVGRGQYASGLGSFGGVYTLAPAHFRIVSSDTTIVSPEPADSNVFVSSPTGGPLRLVGRGVGDVTLTPYFCDVPGPSVAFTATRPKLGLLGSLPSAARTDDPPAAMAITPQDTTGATHFLVAPVTVRVKATDTTVMRSDSAYRHLSAGSAGVTVNLSFTEPGPTRLVVEDSAGVYLPDSSAVVQVAYPPLYIFSDAGGQPDTLHVGLRQKPYYDVYRARVGLDRFVAGAPLRVHVSISDSTIVRVGPDSLDVPVGQSATPGGFDIAARDTRGTAIFTARAHRHADDQVAIVVGRPAVQVHAPTAGYAIYPGDPGHGVMVFAVDSATGSVGFPTESVTFSLTVSDTAVISLDSATVTVPGGDYASTFAGITFKKPGTVTITATDPRVAPYSYAPGTSAAFTILEPYLVADSAFSLGIDQTFGFSVNVNGRLGQGDVVHLVHRNPAVAALADTTMTGSGVVVATGLTAGVDTVIVSAPGFHSDTGTIVVGEGTFEIAQWPLFGLHVNESWPLEVKVLAPNGDIRVTAVTTTFTLTANGNIEFLQDGVPITSVTVDQGQHFTQFSVRGKAAGTGTVTVSATNYTPVTKSVTVAP